MDPKNDISKTATCTTCSFSEDFSNYWTAVLYFRAKNGTFKRVPQSSQISGGVGGITVYYMQDALYDTTQKSKVKAFQPVSLHRVEKGGGKRRETFGGSGVALLSDLT